MVNSNSKSPAAPGAGTSGSIAGAGSIPSGSSAGSGGIASAGSSNLGVIPGSGSKARGGLRTEVTLLANGFGTQFPDGSVLGVKGQSLTKQQVLATLAGDLGLFAAIDSSVRALKSQRQALAAATPDIRSDIAAIKGALVGLFGKGNPVLEAFGIRAAKRRPLSPEQLTARKAKSAQTRGLRGTRGSRAKALVKFAGKVEVQTVVSGNAASGGIPSSAGAPASPTGTNPSSAGAPTGASPSGSGNSAPAPGSGPSQP